MNDENLVVATTTVANGAALVRDRPHGGHDAAVSNVRSPLTLKLS